MRTLRAIYNHARRLARDLPADNPTSGVDWNIQRRRDTAMGIEDLPRWFREAGRLRHPIRREFHLFTLLSGSRPGALMQARVEDLDLQRGVLHIPRPKGGAKRAFDIPLSRPMIRCLIRAMRVGRILHPEAAETWIFAADSAPERGSPLAPTIRSAAISATCEKLTRSRTVSLSDHMRFGAPVHPLFQGHTDDEQQAPCCAAESSAWDHGRTGLRRSRRVSHSRLSGYDIVAAARPVTSRFGA